MGFNNQGSEAIAKRLSHRAGPGHRHIPLGINLGKSKVAPLDQAVADYLASFNHLAVHADYLVLNVSSPNTPACGSCRTATGCANCSAPSPRQGTGARATCVSARRAQAAPPENRARPEFPAD